MEGKRWLALLVVLLAVPVWGLQTVAKGSPVLGASMALAALPAAYALGRLGGLTPTRLRALVLLSTAVGTISILTGTFNGLTDEPYTTARYNSLFPNLYGHAIPSISYVQYGQPITLPPSYDVYLPMLSVLTVPGVPYRWVSLAAWLAMVLLLARRPFAMAALGTPYVALLAASGFNDFVPLALLTVGFAVDAGVASTAARVLSLATKQFSVAFIVLYYAVRREWRWAGVSLALTAAFLAPFFLLSPSGTLCHAIASNPGPCGETPGLLQSRFLLPHLNYGLYPLWALAVFGPTVLGWIRSPALSGTRERACRRLGYPTTPDPGSARDGLVLIVALALATADRLLGRRPPPAPTPGG